MFQVFLFYCGGLGALGDVAFGVVVSEDLKKVALTGRILGCSNFSVSAICR